MDALIGEGMELMAAQQRWTRMFFLKCVKADFKLRSRRMADCDSFYVSQVRRKKMTTSMRCYSDYRQ